MYMFVIKKPGNPNLYLQIAKVFKGPLIGWSLNKRFALKYKTKSEAMAVYEKVVKDSINRKHIELVWESPLSLKRKSAYDRAMGIL